MPYKSLRKKNNMSHLREKSKGYWIEGEGYLFVRIMSNKTQEIFIHYDFKQNVIEYDFLWGDNFVIIVTDFNGKFVDCSFEEYSSPNSFGGSHLFPIFHEFE